MAAKAKAQAGQKPVAAKEEPHGYEFCGPYVLRLCMAVCAMERP